VVSIGSTNGEGATVALNPTAADFGKVVVMMLLVQVAAVHGIVRVVYSVTSVGVTAGGTLTVVATNGLAQVAAVHGIVIVVKEVAPGITSNEESGMTDVITEDLQFGPLHGNVNVTLGSAVLAKVSLTRVTYGPGQFGPEHGTDTVVNEVAFRPALDLLAATSLAGIVVVIGPVQLIPLHGIVVVM
jgi:hypothetical protein